VQRAQLLHIKLEQRIDVTKIPATYPRAAPVHSVTIMSTTQYYSEPNDSIVCVCLVVKTVDNAVYVLKVPICRSRFEYKNLGSYLYQAGLGMVDSEDVVRIGPTDELALSKRWNLGLQTN
jgi:hypothetical protein